MAIALSTGRILSALAQRNVSAMSTLSGLPSFKTLAVTAPHEFVVHVQFNSPEKRNSLTYDSWRELGECFQNLAVNPDCRAIVLSGAGDKSFCAGMNLFAFMNVGTEMAKHDDVARKAEVLRRNLVLFQNSITAMEKCPKPVIAAIHGDCIGAGLDIITATDIRYCSKDAYFTVKEIDIGMAADVGTLQRLPKVIGSSSLVNELVFTGRKMLADEAKECGLVSAVYQSKSQLIEKAMQLACEIAAKSPVAVQTAKKSLIYSRDHSIADGLEHIEHMNVAMLQSEDFFNAVAAAASKSETPVFSKL